MGTPCLGAAGPAAENKAVPTISASSAAAAASQARGRPDGAHRPLPAKASRMTSSSIATTGRAKALTVRSQAMIGSAGSSEETSIVATGAMPMIKGTQ